MGWVGLTKRALFVGQDNDGGITLLLLPGSPVPQSCQTPVMSGTRKQTRSTCTPRVPREENGCSEFPIARWGCELSVVLPTWNETIGKAWHPHPLRNYGGYQLVSPYRPTMHGDARRGTAARKRNCSANPHAPLRARLNVSLSTSIPRLPSFHPSNLIHKSSQAPGATPPLPQTPLPTSSPPFRPPFNDSHVLRA